MKIEVTHSLFNHTNRRAFTLIELMISIALVLLLILGVNQVFTYTTQAVGAGEAINAAIRSSRAAQAQMSDDFAGIVANGSGPNNSGCMIISSRAYYAFRNAKDLASQGPNASSAPTAYPTAAFIDINGDGQFGDTNVNGEVVYPSNYNFRNHRLDTLSFFSRGLFPRQTGNPGTFVDNLASQEAWIWYGHLQLPDNGGNQRSDYPNGVGSGPSTFPCMGTTATNPNNCFGSQLVLGRVAMNLLPPVTPPSGPNYIVDRQNYYQDYSGNTGNLTPLASNSQIGGPAISNESFTQYYLSDSRIDLAGTTISSYQQQLSAAIPTNAYWWDTLMSGRQDYAVTGTYSRFKCDPFVAKPMTAQAMAQASPYFLGGCSQFIVEFAGDFLTQDNDPNSATYGAIVSAAADGNIDYIVLNPGTPQQRKQIIWYGLPRNTSGLSGIKPYNGDVAPLNYWTHASGSPYTFEHNGPAYKTDYSGGSGMSATEANAGYTCAFGPNDPHPKLIRITITLDDPTGRLPDGQTYQYVFAVP